MGYKIGLEGKLYRGTAGSTATTEVTNVKDLSDEIDADVAEISNRAGGGWKSYRPTLKDVNLSWNMLWDPACAHCLFFKNAFLNGTPIALAVLDGAGGKGLDADFYVTKWGRNEPLTEGMEVPVEVKITTENRAPAWPD